MWKETLIRKEGLQKPSSPFLTSASVKIESSPLLSQSLATGTAGAHAKQESALELGLSHEGKEQTLPPCSANTEEVGNDVGFTTKSANHISLSQSWELGSLVSDGIKI